MHEIIRLDELTVLVMKDGSETGGQFCLCEVSVQPHTKRTFAHRHYTFDQTVVGMDGLMVWALGREQVVIGPGERLFIPRGTAHGFLNRQAYPARFLCLYSPAIITPQFFTELQDAEQSAAEDRIAQVDAVLGRYGSEQVVEPRTDLNSAREPHVRCLQQEVLGDGSGLAAIPHLCDVRSSGAAW